MTRFKTGQTGQGDVSLHFAGPNHFEMNAFPDTMGSNLGTLEEKSERSKESLVGEMR